MSRLAERSHAIAPNPDSLTAARQTDRQIAKACSVRRIAPAWSNENCWHVPCGADARNRGWARCFPLPVARLRLKGTPPAAPRVSARVGIFHFEGGSVLLRNFMHDGCAQARPIHVGAQAR